MATFRTGWLAVPTRRVGTLFPGNGSLLKTIERAGENLRARVLLISENKLRWGAKGLSTMARPKKDSPSPNAKDRMIDAFWASLETYRIEEVTVSMVTSLAECNRGSFYYHFKSVQELARAAFERDCVNRNSAARAIFALVSGNHFAAVNAIFDDTRLWKMELIGAKGAMSIAGEETCAALNGVWEVIACAKGEPLSAGTRGIIDFVNFGIARYVSNAYHVEPEAKDRHSSALFLRDLVSFTIQEIARFQQIAQDEALARLKTLVDAH